MNHHVANTMVYLDLDRLDPASKTFKLEKTLSIPLAAWNDDSNQSSIRKLLNELLCLD